MGNQAVAPRDGQVARPRRTAHVCGRDPSGLRRALEVPADRIASLVAVHEQRDDKPHIQAAGDGTSDRVGDLDVEELLERREYALSGPAKGDE